ncbi:unnamed protein product [Brassicogethes aeneus]|uniref:Uncharacterized protein n=1 Tax=Brassicogethes aeneus TaxID=1431903 RepID=A0A9P0FHV0_BRAAE|nr:unnamed protein product [Brassicogethes aeneus]
MADSNLESKITERTRRAIDRIKSEAENGKFKILQVAKIYHKRKEKQSDWKKRCNSQIINCCSGFDKIKKESFCDKADAASVRDYLDEVVNSIDFENSAMDNKNIDEVINKNNKKELDENAVLDNKNIYEKIYENNKEIEDLDANIRQKINENNNKPYENPVLNENIQEKINEIINIAKPVSVNHDEIGNISDTEKKDINLKKQIFDTIDFSNQLSVTHEEVYEANVNKVNTNFEKHIFELKDLGNHISVTHEEINDITKTVIEERTNKEKETKDLKQDVLDTKSIHREELKELNKIRSTIREFEKQISNAKKSDLKSTEVNKINIPLVRPLDSKSIVKQVKEVNEREVNEFVQEELKHITIEAKRRLNEIEHDAKEELLKLTVNQ